MKQTAASEGNLTCGMPSQSSASCMASVAFSTGFTGSQVSQSGHRPANSTHNNTVNSNNVQRHNSWENTATMRSSKRPNSMFEFQPSENRIFFKRDDFYERDLWHGLEAFSAETLRMDFTVKFCRRRPVSRCDTLEMTRICILEFSKKSWVNVISRRKNWSESKWYILFIQKNV